ncbi:hypothetical protein QEN19_003094 [Hanseniaspora menglaensis]
MIQFKLVLLGDSSVGKSSIVTRFVKDQFDINKESTIGAAFLSQTIKLLDSETNDEVAVKFEIWDTAGQERYKSLAPMYYRNSNAAIVVYDITDANSLSKAVKWVNELKEKLGDDNDCVISLIGNKLDLINEDETKRAISRREGEEFAIENGLYFHEVSAKENIGIKDIFQEIGESLYNQHKEKKLKNATTISRNGGNSNVELNRPSTNDATSCCS